nr:MULTISPECIES: hypothetical protein [Mycobacteriaceae]
MQLLNNDTVLHSREEYTDHDDPAAGGGETDAAAT